MLFSLVQKLNDLPVVFVDTETTGASAELGDRVIEVGCVRVEGGKIAAQYQQLIDPKRRIGAGVTALTGITQEMVSGQPTFAGQFQAMIQVMRGAVVVGHNVRFDLSFLSREFRLAGGRITEILGEVPVLDTVRIAWRRFGRGGNGLQVLSRRLGIEPVVAHRALADALTTRQVLERLLEPAGGWGCCLSDAIQEQGGPMGLLPKTQRQSLLPLELEEALEMRLAVRMEYLDADGRRTQRTIRPLHVRRKNGELILVAHCQLRDAQRTFKLERIVRLVRADEEGAQT